MGENIICTIITADYGHYALALHDSIIQFNPNIGFAVFLSKGNLLPEIKVEAANRKNLTFYNIEDVSDISIAIELIKKYSENYHDAFRWGMKPVFINILLDRFEKVIYIDSDIYFFSDYNFLFKKLDTSNILLTPHWRSSNPSIEYSNFVHNFRDGIYNAGFIGASQHAKNAMNWWAEMILFKCDVNRKDGYYVDQRYLDILPIHFEGVELIKHKGCNVANWNKVECKRTLNDEGKVLINNKYPIVFIHFTNTMLTGIFYEKDFLLKPFLIKYRDNLLKYSNLDIIEDYFKNGKFKKPRSEDDFTVKKSKYSVELMKRSKTLLKKIIKKVS